MSSGELATKYQKLAQEYAKLKAQVSVLKKAVIDEQSKSKVLEDSVKDKDQSLRKCMQEIDSLTFRNQQISRRLVVLQEDLESKESAKKGKRKGAAAPVPSMATGVAAEVHAEELQKKITENEQLHMQVFEVKQESQEQVQRLEAQLALLEQQNESHQEVMDGVQTKHGEELSLLQDDKALKEVRLQKLEEELSVMKERASTSERQLSQTKGQLTNESSTMARLVSEKLPFNDTVNPDWNVFNVPTYDRKQQMKAQELIGQASRLVHELTSGLANFMNYLEQRATAYPIDAATGESISIANQRLCRHLHGHAAWVKPLDQTFASFKSSLRKDVPVTLETCTGLQQFVNAYHNFVINMQKSLPYQLISLDEESRLSSCPPTLERHNNNLRDGLRRVIAAFVNLDTYLQLVAAQALPSCAQPACNRTAIFRKLTTCLLQLHRRIKEMSACFSSKVAQEHLLPTASQKLKTTNECVLSSLASVVACTDKIGNFVQSNLEYITVQAGLQARGASMDVTNAQTEQGRGAVSAVQDLRRKAATYMESLQRPAPESVPYYVALLNNTTMLSSTENRDSLALQVSDGQQRIYKLEMEKEHWMLEAQLLQIKMEKEQKKIGVMQTELAQLREAGACGGIVLNQPPAALSNAARDVSEPGSPRSRKPIIVTGAAELGRMSSSTADADDGDADSRADLIKHHFTQRIQELATHIQEAESKAAHFNAECRAAHRRLAMAEKSKEKAFQDLEGANQQIQHLRDENQTTSSSYESQMSMMSDHLCGLTDKLTAQKDEIDALKMQGSKGSVKKGKR